MDGLQPIDTAPTDGTPVEVFTADAPDQFNGVDARYIDGKWTATINTVAVHLYPTHWRQPAKH